VVSQFVYNGLPFAPVWTGLNLSPLTEPGSWFTSLVAGTNPSRPEVTPLTLIQDLIDIPKQLRDIGQLLTKPARSLGAKDLANQNLAFQFGWLPLVKDLHVLLDLQLHILRRTREIGKLYSTSGLRRRMTIAEDHQVGSYAEKQILNSSCSVTFRQDLRVTRRMWATIHWRPTKIPPGHPNDFDTNRLVRHVVLGLTPEGLTQGAWDLVPWTWLIDWFVDVGAFLGTHSNTIPAEHSSACLMSEVVGVAVPSIAASAPRGYSTVKAEGTFTYSRRQRILSGSIVPGFSIPFIGVRRLSVLGSLYVQRFMR